jgi:hypothetical protein
MAAKYKKYFLISMAILCTAPFVCAEYLLVKETPERLIPLTEQEHASAYDILMKYQFPMNTNPAWHLEQELNPQELEAMFTNEHSFLQEKITQALGQAVKVTFIPTTLYEVLIITILEKTSLDFPSFSSCSPAWHSIAVLDAQNTDKLHDLYRENNQLRFHRFINDRITEIIGKEIDPQSLQISRPIAEKTLNEQKELLIKTSRKKLSFRQPEKKLYDTARKALIYDYEAYATGCHVLYRGTSGHDSSITRTKRSDSVPHSLSFGQTLFGGYYRDWTACTFFIIQECISASYSLFVNKYEYYKKTNNLFFLPPTNTLASLFGKGEFFHPRTKVFLQNSSVGHCSGVCCYKISDLPPIIKTDANQFTSAKTFDQALMDFIYKNRRMFNPGGWNPIHWSTSVKIFSSAAIIGCAAYGIKKWWKK